MSDLEHAEARITELLQEVDKYKLQVKDMSEHLYAVETANERVKKDCDNLTKENEELKNTNTALCCRVEGLTSQCKTFEDINCELKLQLREAKSNLDNLSKAYADRTAQYEFALEEKGRAENRIRDLRDETVNLTAIVSRLSKAVENLSEGKER